MTKLTITLDIDAKELYRQRLLLAYLARFDIDGYPIDGLLNLTDAIADELADTGNNNALLTGSSQENRLGTRMLDDLRQTLNFKPPEVVRTLKPCVVKLVKKGDSDSIDFPCHAYGLAHARQQAEKAYAGCTIKQVFEYVGSNTEET